MMISPKQASQGPTTTGRERGTRPSRRARLVRDRRAEAQAGARHDARVPPVRASRVLRDFLARNPGVERFTVKHIVESLERGGAGPGAPLMVFSIPAIVPIPGTADLVGAPTMALSRDLVAGRGQLRLPPQILERSVPRRSLALAIHAALPVLERAEKLTRKRWAWACTPAAQRVIGILVFLLALPLAFPILGFGAAHASALFTISLGMIEKDGAAVALGVTAGIAALVFLTGKSLSPKVLAQKAADWLRGIVAQMTSVKKAAAAILKRAWRWLSVELLSGPSRAATPAGKATPERARIAHRPAPVLPAAPAAMQPAALLAA